MAAFVLALAVLAASATPSFAAKRKVPFGFFGTVYNVEADRPSDSEATREQQVDLMARSGVESMRVFLAWPAIQPGPNTYNWAHTDRVVAAAARHRISDSRQRARHAAVGLLAPELRVPAAARRPRIRPSTPRSCAP